MLKCRRRRARDRNTTRHYLPTAQVSRQRDYACQVPAGRRVPASTSMRQAGSYSPLSSHGNLWRSCVDTPPLVQELVGRFRRNRSAYLADSYKEAQLRQEFIDPLFESLGWDMANAQGYAEAYKDVIHEASLKIGAETKAPDYCMRIGGIRKFFVEAKKPAINIKMAAEPAYQLRRYAWSAKLPLSILTNFNGFAVYDCTRRPQQLEHPGTARLMYLRFDQLDTQWQEIADLFSRDGVLKGFFDTYAASTTSKRGTLEVDQAFLAEIDDWRSDLARNISRRNRTLTQEDLNWVVQQTIDRIVFLRISEDRGIEPYGQLRDAVATKAAYEALGRLFQQADRKYNSGLFHFGAERHREPPDTLSLKLSVDNRVLRSVVSQLYYPDSPYEFSVLPPDILGQVYEQFLGKQISLDDRGVVRIEYKPEVAKAGGVYYTPSHIARYITHHTIDPILGALTLEEARGNRGHPPRILDPACGSGTFLLIAYERLLEWYHGQYAADPGRWASGKAPPIREDGMGGWRLTTVEKKAILIRHIFGVDLDPRAVEVTKLSLLLKVLEGESQESLESQLALFHQRALPDLEGNVKCGNSLVEPDFLLHGAGKHMSNAERMEINPFDWRSEFKLAFDDRGFDAVVGNPPWLMAGYHVKPVLPYFAERYATARGKYDLYYLFLERALDLVSSTGRMGMIVPNKLFHTRAGSALRALLSGSNRLEEVVDFGDSQVFARATNYSCILVLGADASHSVQFTRMISDLTAREAYRIAAADLSAAPWQFEGSAEGERFARIRADTQPLRDLVAHFGNGVQTGADRILLLKPQVAEAASLEPELLRPFLRGRDVRRYSTAEYPSVVLFPYKVAAGRYVLLDEGEMAGFPNALRYLTLNRAALDGRVWFGKSAADRSGNWYGLMYVDNPEAFEPVHLLTPSLARTTNFAVAEGSLFATGTAGVTSAVLRTGVSESPYYLMAILNSALLSHYATSHSPIFRGGFHKFSRRYIEDLPIRRIHASRRSDVRMHRDLHDLAVRRADLAKRLAAASTPHARTTLGREAEEIDLEIDRRTFELYGVAKEDAAAMQAAEIARLSRDSKQQEAADEQRPTPAL